MSGPVRFFFDFVSPYAYLGWKEIHAVAGRIGREVDPVPIVFGAIAKRLGAVPPADNPPRYRYIKERDVPRRARALGVPLRWPAEHPYNPLLALRVASLPMAAPARREIISRLFDACWGEGLALTDRAVVAAASGLPEAELALAEAAETKDRLRAQTEEALAAGIFGVPSMLVDGELYFGAESFPFLEQAHR